MVRMKNPTAEDDCIRVEPGRGLGGGQHLVERSLNSWWSPIAVDYKRAKDGGGRDHRHPNLARASGRVAPRPPGCSCGVGGNGTSDSGDGIRGGGWVQGVFVGEVAI